VACVLAALCTSNWSVCLLECKAGAVWTVDTDNQYESVLELVAAAVDWIISHSPLIFLVSC